MDINNLLQDLDERLFYGDFTGPIKRYFDDQVKIISGKESFVGKEERLSSINRFLDDLLNINSINLHGNMVDGAQTFSVFTFSFTQSNGDDLSWYEIIRRKWKDGKVVEEEYIIHPSEEQIQAILSKKAPPATKSVAPAASEATATKSRGRAKAAAPATAKSKAAKPAKPVATRIRSAAPKAAVAEGSELRQIAGIGQKVDELLNAAGINTFAQLAKTTKERLQKILSNAGPRFKEFDATPWIQEAKNKAK